VPHWGSEQPYGVSEKRPALHTGCLALQDQADTHHHLVWVYLTARLAAKVSPVLLWFVHSLSKPLSATVAAEGGSAGTLCCCCSPDSSQ
jgi:hypothetical protein